MKSKKELCSTFARFEEYYESPFEEIRGKVFTREYFFKLYKDTYGDKYVESWSGFNVPEAAFKPFLEGKFDPLVKSEQKLLDLIKNIPDDDFYVMGIIKGDTETLIHELSHSLFGTDPVYAKRQQMLYMLCIPSNYRQMISEHLTRKGYCDDVLLDEAIAYLIDDPGEFEHLFPRGHGHYLKDAQDNLKNTMKFFLADPSIVE
jgi:hypothetical protein